MSANHRRGLVWSANHRRGGSRELRQNKEAVKLCHAVSDLIGLSLCYLIIVLCVAIWSLYSHHSVVSDV
jgi:hypothetical protein